MANSDLAWLDPERDQMEVPKALAVKRGDLERAGRQLLGEPLLAQRLISAGGVDLDQAELAASSLDRWGHTLPTRIAVLRPPPVETTSPSDRRARRKYQELLLRAQESWPDLASTSDTAFLVCSDSHAPEVGLPNQLYPTHDPSGLLEHDKFGWLLDQLIRAVSPVVAPAWMASKVGLRESLAVIVAETFKNTHDHAVHEIDQSDVEHSLRGLYARYCGLDDIADMGKELQGHEYSPALRFASNFLPRLTPAGVRKKTEAEIAGVLEIAVFDSGPGMAAKWLRRPTDDVAIDAQMEAVLACFDKGRTTTGTTGRGYGLAKVMQNLKSLHGFMAVRTNQIHAYRQFGWLPGTGSTETPDGMTVPIGRLYDWKRQLTFKATKCAPVRGTVVSFLLPMGVSQ